MIKLLTELNLLDFFLGIAAIFIMVMGTVYIPGRMFEFVNNFRIKNLIALLSSIGFSYFYIINNIKTNNIIYSLILYSLTTIVIYVLVGFRLFDRIDNVFDKKFGKDKGFKRK